MSSHRVKEHHTTPRFLLRGFADTDAYGKGDGRIVMHDLKSGRTHDDQRIKKVVQETNFYSITAPDHELSSVVEDLLSRVEADVGPLLARAADGEPSWSDDEWRIVSLFVALQHLRGPGERRLWFETSQSLDQLRGLVDGLPTAVGDRDDAVTKMLQLATPTVVEIAAAYTPVMLRWPPRSLLTSDNPLLLIDDGTPVALSVKTAGGMFLGVDDATGLLLWNHECWGGPPRRRFQPSTHRAQNLNQGVVAQSVRQVLWHPEATRERLLGPDFEFPPYRERGAPRHVDDQSSKIAQVLQWAEANPDQPHPVSGLPRIEVDPRARPLSPELRRRLTAAGFFS